MKETKEIKEAKETKETKETKGTFWDGISEKNKSWIRRFCLMDDAFMSMIFQKLECTQLLLRLILERTDLTVKKVRTQHEMKNLWGRSSRLDILAVDRDGKYYNIEVQRKDEGADPRRARYYSALLDTNITEPGEHFENLAETYVIFITENDVLGAGKPLYHIKRMIEETGKEFKDGTHIIYVNSKVQDKTGRGKLMHDLYCTDPDDMYYKELADEVRYYKQEEKGVSQMCKILEEIRDDGIAQGIERGRMEGRMEGEMKQKKATAFYLQKMGLPIESIAGAVDQKPSIIESWFKETSASAR